MGVGGDLANRPLQRFGVAGESDGPPNSNLVCGLISLSQQRDYVTQSRVASPRRYSGLSSKQIFQP